LGNGIFQGNFNNDATAWYFLAKGIFCSVTICLVSNILEALKSGKAK
jgi:hypothetical protein